MSYVGTPEGASPSAQPKQISSRLLNMKFMQRAAASSPNNNTSTPSTPTGQPAFKRRRTGDFSTTVDSLNSPVAASTTTSTPVQGDRAAHYVARFEETNGSSIRRGTNNFDTAGEETEWVLNVRIPFTNGTNGSYNDSDEPSEEDEHDEIWSSTAPRGRQTYGAFDKKKRRTTDHSKSDMGTTPTSAGQSSKKRSREDDDEDLSSVPSNSDSDDGSEDGELEESPKPKRKAAGKFNLKSEQDLKKMDSFNFQKAGLDHGFGRQRPGLGGGGGGGGGSAFSTPSQGRGQGKKHKKKARKTM